MKRLNLFILIAVFSVACSQTAQVTNKQQSDASTNPHENLDFPELNDFQKPEVETFTIDNGITFYLVEDNELPLINVSARIRTGEVLVPQEKTGLATITGTVMRSGGTETYPADSLNTLLENRAASIETNIGFSSGNASMNVLKEDFEDLLPVYIDILTNPAFPEEKIKLAKTQTQSAISRRNDNSQQIGVREFQKIIYGVDSPYGRTTEYETINNISREDLVNFHDEHFTAENMMVGVVGDFETEQMKQKLENIFGSIPTGDKTTLKFPEVNYEPQSSINFANKSDVNQSFVMMGHLGGMRDNPDYAKVQVMNRVLSGGFSGRLMQIVRTEMGLAYSVFGQYGMNSFYPGMFYAGVMTKSATTAEAIDAIIEQIKRLQNEPITEQELQDVKDQILNSSVFEYDSYEEVLRQQMSYAYRGLPEDAFEQYIEGVRETTIEDVQRVAQEYLDPDNLQILVVGNRDEIGDQLDKYGEVNEIDITIPQPGSDKNEVVKGDAQKGRKYLDLMAEAVISNGTKLNSISLKGAVVQGSMNMPVEMTINYPDAIEQTIKSPQGVINLSYEGGSGTMTMGGQERPLPPQMSQSLSETLNRNYVAISQNKDSFEPQFLGVEEFEDKKYAQVGLSVDGKNITLLINPENGYPRLMRYEQFNPQAGTQVQVEERYSDWNTTGGVSYAYKEVTYVEGNKSAEANYENHSVD